MNIESLIKELKTKKKNFNIRAETKYLHLIFEMSDFYFRIDPRLEKIRCMIYRAWGASDFSASTNSN